MISKVCDWKMEDGEYGEKADIYSGDSGHPT